MLAWPHEIFLPIGSDSTYRSAQVPFSDGYINHISVGIRLSALQRCLVRGAFRQIGCRILAGFDMMKLTIGFLTSLAFATLLPWLGHCLYLPPADDAALNRTSHLERRTEKRRHVVFGVDVLYAEGTLMENPDKRTALAVHSWLEFRATFHDEPLRVSLVSEDIPGPYNRQRFIVQAAKLAGHGSISNKAQIVPLPFVKRHTVKLRTRVDLTNDELLHSSNGQGILYDIWSADPEYRVGPSSGPGQPSRYNGCNRLIWNLLAHRRMLGPTSELQTEEPEVHFFLMLGFFISETRAAPKIARDVQLSLATMHVEVQQSPEGLCVRETISSRKSWEFYTDGLLRQTTQLQTRPQEYLSWPGGDHPDEMPSLTDVPMAIENTGAPSTNVPPPGADVRPPIPVDNGMTAFDNLAPLFPEGLPNLPPWPPGASQWGEMTPNAADNAAIDPTYPSTAMEDQRFDGFQVDSADDPRFYDPRLW